VKHLALLATTLALVTAACGSGGAVAEGNVKDLVAPARYPAHFAGVPPQGTHASTPTTGTLVLSFDFEPKLSFGAEPIPSLSWSVYADGRVIWQKWSSTGDPIVIPPGASMIDTGYVQQRLTSQGVQLLRAKILSTGLFDQNLKVRVGRHRAVINGRVRRGDHMVTFAAWPPGLAWQEHITKATPAQAHGLAQIQALLADTAVWSLPTTAWADREVRGFVPARYFYAYDRSAPDLAKLPSPLLPYKKLLGQDCQTVTTGELRAILQAFLEAGITPVSNHAGGIGFALEGLHGHPSAPHFSPVLPSDSPC
jgi:hypothetical protein